MIEQKPCKAQNKAKSFQGCGTITDVKLRRFGLCPKCLYKWMKETEEGKKYYQSQFIPKVSAKIRKNEKEQTKQKKIDLMSPDKYRKEYLQPVINKIARLIDYGCSCIATDNYGKMNGGHYRSVGSNRTIALNLHNIHIQSYESNVFRGGDDKNYKDGLIDRYGLEYFEFVDSLRNHPVIKLTTKQMQEIYKKAKSICGDLEKNLVQLQPEQRILLRNQINIELGIYKKQYSTFKLLTEWR